ncbi:MAG TPA: acyl carrier protein [Elusimicrobia bacterium]|nr:acyl carrier protein [Elusimicrobiota bacterium]
MTREQLASEINAVLAAQFELKPESLQDPETKLNDDLGLDSLDAIDLVVTMEKKFGCRILEAEAREVRTLSQLYDCVHKAKSP